MRRSSLVVLLAVLASLFVLPATPTTAATFRDHVARSPETPTSQQVVTVRMASDTAFGETAGLEYNVGSSYTRVLGTFVSYNSATNTSLWDATIPAFPDGTLVRYQLFTRNQTGDDYGFSGFNWSYTVDDGDIQWNGLRHDSFDSYYRSPFGAVSAGTQVTLRFRTLPLDVSAVSLRVYSYDPATSTTAAPVDYPLSYLEDRVESGTTYAIWSITLTTPSSPAIWYYKFRVQDGLDTDWYGDNSTDDHDNLGQGGEGAPSDDEPFPAFQLTVYQPGFVTPTWLQNANVYQIFPDRFRNGDITNDYCRAGASTGCPVFYGNPDVVAHTTWNEAINDPRQPGDSFNDYGNQFYGGDLWGVIEKLDYLQSVGFDTLYFTPIFAGRSNHRYDTDNYLTIDPALGGDAAFQALVQELERRGMRLILDGVFNHASSDSLYFDRYGRYASDGACENLSSPYREWFLFNTSATPCTTGDYPGWFGFDSLAVFDDGNAALRDFIYRNGAQNVVQYWYEQGVSGWRFDVADEISHDWWRDFRPYARADAPEGPLVGEVWPDASRFLLGEQLDSVMNYRFRKNLLGFARDQYDWGDNDNNGSNRIVPLSPSQFDRALKAVREDYPPEATKAMLNLIDSHDTNRALYVLSLLGESEAQAKERLRLAALFQFTYLGAPMVYYGDEAGIDSPSVANGVNGPEDDPYNRAPYPWADESGDVNVYGPADASLIAYYSTLAHLRKQSDALRQGEFVTLLTGDTTPATGDDDTYAFARVAGSEVAVVALNQGAGSNSVSLPVGAYFADGTLLADALNGGSYSVSGGRVSLTLDARSGVILLPAPAAADTTPPTVSAAITPAPNAAGWNSGPVTVALAGVDSDSGVRELRHWVNDGAATVVAGATASVPVSAEGITTVSARAIDEAFNGSAVATATVKIDSTAPAVSASYVDNGDGTATVTMTASDGGSGLGAVSYSVNGGAPQSYSGPFGVSGYGAYTIAFTATDLAGNQSGGSLGFTLQAPVTNAAISPVLECVRTNGPGSYTAFFGYKNNNTVTVSIPVGANNRFTPLPQDRGQTTSFLPGRQVRQFSVTWGGGNLVWTLKGPDGKGRTSTASPSSRACP